MADTVAVMCSKHFNANFLLGTCIGFYNQRYFVILNFYLGIAMTGKSIIFFSLSQGKTMSYSKLPNDTDCNKTTMVVKNFKFGDVCITDIVRKIILKTIKLWLIFIYDKIE